SGIVWYIENVVGHQGHVRRLAIHNLLQLDEDLSLRASSALPAVDVGLLGRERRKPLRHSKHFEDGSVGDLLNSERTGFTYIAYNKYSTDFGYADLFSTFQFEIQLGIASLHQFLYANSLYQTDCWIGRIGAGTANENLRPSIVIQPL